MLDEKSDTAEAAQTAIGQGKTTITPLQNALISATIANDGVMMTPYLVDHTESVDGHVVKKYEPQEKRTAISRKRANQVTRMMRSVVSDGIGSSFKESVLSGGQVRQARQRLIRRGPHMHGLWALRRQQTPRSRSV